jgi:hypothetical protein
VASVRGLVLPRLSSHLHKRYYAVAAVHGRGGIARLCILLLAGPNLLPEAWRFMRWNLWMCLELALDGCFAQRDRNLHPLIDGRLLRRNKNALWRVWTLEGLIAACRRKHTGHSVGWASSR